MIKQPTAGGATATPGPDPARIGLFLFHAEKALTLRCRDAGIDGMILDLERRGKESRQAQFDTQISIHELQDLDWLRRNYAGRIICRVNGGRALVQKEVCTAAALGADEILLPMVTDVATVEKVRDWLPAETALGIMIETLPAVTQAERFAACPITRAYVGLNDLAIAGACRNIFRPLADGTVAQLRRVFRVPLGVAGLTHPTLGHPIGSILFLAEMRRLGIDFTFLRRSFYRDLAHFEPAEIVAAVREQWKAPGLEAAHSRARLRAAINALEPGQHADPSSAP